MGWSEDGGSLVRGQWIGCHRNKRSRLGMVCYIDCDEMVNKH